MSRRWMATALGAGMFLLGLVGLLLLFFAGRTDDANHVRIEIPRPPPKPARAARPSAAPAPAHAAPAADDLGPPEPGQPMTAEEAQTVAKRLENAMNDTYRTAFDCHEPAAPVSWDDVALGPGDDPNETRIVYLQSYITVHLDDRGLNRVEWVGEDGGVSDSELDCLADVIWGQDFPGATGAFDIELPAKQQMFAPQAWIDANPGVRMMVAPPPPPE